MRIKNAIEGLQQLAAEWPDAELWFEVQPLNPAMPLEVFTAGTAPAYGFMSVIGENQTGETKHGILVIGAETVKAFDAGCKDKEYVLRRGRGRGLGK